MVSSKEALDIILNNVAVSTPVTVSLGDSLGYSLAVDIRAEENVPSFDNAAMDGFAVLAEDTLNAPRSLNLVGEIAAGSSSTPALKPGEAIRIMTGAPIPEHCSAVVQQEWTTQGGEASVTIGRTVSPGHNIRKAGTDIARGAVVFTQGWLIRPQEIGVLASIGKQFVQVFRKPRIAILATGNELVEIDRSPGPGKIRNSNAHLLSALVRQTGCEAILCPIARDDADDLKSKIKDGLRADILISTGGVSVGKYDLVCKALEDLGVEILFRKVNIKPGMPLVFGKCGSTLVFGLPGNPVSTAITFMQFVRPAIDAKCGRKDQSAKLELRAKLAREITKSDGKRHFIRGILENDAGGLVVDIAGSQVSNILTSLTKANCLIVVPEDVGHYSAGDDVRVELMI